MKILFYSLNAAIWVHALPENRLVRELSRRGHETIYVSCGKSFTGHCTSMTAFGIPLDAPAAEKAKICEACVGNAKTLVGANGARHLVLANYVTDDDRKSIDALMLTITRNNYLDFRVKGVEVGRLATYEAFLNFKKMSENLTPEEWSYYCTYVKNCLVSIFGFSRLWEVEKPNIMFVYSPQYGTNGVCAEFANIHGTTVYFIEGSSSNSERYAALRIWDWDRHGLVNPALEHWSAAKNLVTEEDVSRVSGHLDELLKAGSFAVYSSPIKRDFSLRSRFGIPATSKIVLVTLSSYDEAYAAFIINKFPERKVKSSVFKNQFEWVDCTVRILGGRKDVFLIIRVHPRDFRNKREAVRSEQARLWETLFRSTPDNVAINWPQDDISLYDLLREVDVVLTGWSATGIEALVFGIPVVTYDRHLPSYPADIHLSGESESEYYRNIEIALRIGRQHDHVTNAYRWLAVSFSLGTVRIAAPMATEPVWLPFFLRARAIGRLAEYLIRNAIKWFDSRRGFSAPEDAERFCQLVDGAKGSLFEVVGNRPSDPSAIARVVEREHESFLRAVGIGTVSQKHAESERIPDVAGRRARSA